MAMRSVLFFGIILAQGVINPAHSSTEPDLHLPIVQIVHAYVTGYNTVPEQNGTARASRRPAPISADVPRWWLAHAASASGRF
jgi:hypothetical protein